MPKFAKGSPEMKAHMAKLRAMRGSKLKGGLLDVLHADKSQRGPSSVPAGKGVADSKLFFKRVMPKIVEKNMGKGVKPMCYGGEGIGTDDEDSDSDMEGEGIKEMFNNSKIGKAVNRLSKRHSGVIKAIGQDPDAQDFYHGKLAPYHRDIDAIKRHFGGEGIKEDFNNSKVGKAINKGVKKHKGLIDAIRNDPSVQDIYHGATISPYHKDIDAVVNHFGGNGLGIVHVHHHHHLHGEGWLDDAGNFFKNAGNTIKSGFEQKIIQPVEQKIVNPIKNIPAQVQSNPAYDALVNKFGKGYLAKKKGGLATDILHYGIPAAASTLGSAVGTSAGLTLTGGMPMAGLAGGMAGSALGNRLGEQWAAKAQRETGTGIRRRRKRT